jgi:hypothetical protein
VAAMPLALRKRWLHAQVENLGLGQATRRQVELLSDLLDGSSLRAVTLGRRWRLRRFRSRLWIEPARFPQDEYTITLDGSFESRLPIPGWQVRLTTDPYTSPKSEMSWQPHGAGTLIVTDPRSSAGFARHESMPTLPKILAKTLPRHLRLAWPVVSVDGTIGWVPGVWQHPETGKNSSVSVEVSRRWPN